MPRIMMTRDKFLADTQGRTFADVLNDPEQPFDAALEFFSDAGRQRRMEDSEIHHDRPALAGVVREFELHPEINRFLAEVHAQKSKRFRQAIGVVVRMIMEVRGWQKTGRKGSLGVRAVKDRSQPNHNTGGLAFWFIRAERYQRRRDAIPVRSGALPGVRCSSVGRQEITTVKWIGPQGSVDRGVPRKETMNPFRIRIGPLPASGRATFPMAPPSRSSQEALWSRVSEWLTR